MRKTLATLAVLVATGLALAGCDTTDPCATLSPPSVAEQQAAAQGSEIEREVGSVECVVSGNRWVQDPD